MTEPYKYAIPNEAKSITNRMFTVYLDPSQRWEVIYKDPQIRVVRLGCFEWALKYKMFFTLFHVPHHLTDDMQIPTKKRGKK